MHTDTPHYLQMRGVSKRYGGTQALRNVDFSARQGEVHAIVGENGAGKSTLTRILTGAIQSDAGEILLDGKPRAIDSPLRGQQLGIRMVHQHVNLVPNLSVTENILLGSMPTGRLTWWIDWPAAQRRAQETPRGDRLQGNRRAHPRLPPERVAASGGGDRQGGGRQAEDPDHGRALRRPRPGRPQDPVRIDQASAGARRADPLHLASP